jgi:hypothetical protein
LNKALFLVSCDLLRQLIAQPSTGLLPDLSLLEVRLLVEFGTRCEQVWIFPKLLFQRFCVLHFLKFTLDAFILLRNHLVLMLEQQALRSVPELSLPAGFCLGVKFIFLRLCLLLRLRVGSLQF